MASATSPGVNFERLLPLGMDDPLGMGSLLSTIMIAELGAEGSLLSEQAGGDERAERLLERAANDGSSYVCGGCGGLVSVERRAQHEQFWCGKGSDDNDDAMDDD